SWLGVTGSRPRRAAARSASPLTQAWNRVVNNLFLLGDRSPPVHHRPNRRQLLGIALIEGGAVVPAQGLVVDPQNLIGDLLPGIGPRRPPGGPRQALSQALIGDQQMDGGGQADRVVPPDQD